MDGFWGILIGSFLSAILGVIFTYILGDKIRDWYSIKQENTLDGDGNQVSNVSIKTSGSLTFKNKPVYVQNTIKINSLVIQENQRESVVATPIDDTLTILTPKIPTESELTIHIEGSGTTTVSGTLSKKSK